MEIYFNELSVLEITELTYDMTKQLIGLYRRLCDFGINTCRISYEEHLKLIKLISDKKEFINFKNFYFSFFRTPYESESTKRREDEYYSHNWSYQGEECLGLVLGYLLDSLVLSIYQEKWNQVSVLIDMDEKKVPVRHISLVEHITEHEAWLHSLNDIELLECPLSVEEKSISLRDDHGKDVLLDFSKRIIQNPYVYSVLNSLPYNPHARKFIKKVREDGLVEIVLPWTDAGFGIVVKTTGRSLEETEKIADILQEEYGYL